MAFIGIGQTPTEDIQQSIAQMEQHAKNVMWAILIIAAITLLLLATTKK